MTKPRERIARPLERGQRPEVVWPQLLVGAVLILAAVGLALHRYGAQGIPRWAVILVAFVTGMALVWSPLDSAAETGARRPDAVVILFNREYWPRVAVGMTLALVAILGFVNWRFTENAIVRAVVVPVGVLAALALLFAPWWLRLIRQVSVERRERVREFERAEIAAHLHDSVLQTLTLIRRHADDSEMVARLARSQERDLRTYLYQDQRSEQDSVAAALTKVISDIEDAHGVAIDVVTVGDAPTDTPLVAAVKAAREAGNNAARYGQEPISVYAEVANGRLEVWVRDSGPGFNAKRVPADRMGIRESIVGRVYRHGGTATIASSKGKRTEVHISMPVAERRNSEEAKS